MRRLAAAGAAIGVLMAACGGGGNPASVAALRDAPKRTTDARSARMEVATERSGSGGPASGAITLTGEADCQAHRGHMLIDLSQLGLPGPPVDAVFDNATVYEKFPQSLAAALPAGKSWVKVDLATAGTDVGANGATDPCRSLDYLRGVSAPVTRVGTEDVRGTPTTHYRALADLNTAADRSPTAREQIKSSIKVLGSSRQPLDVWVDAQGRVRRMKYVVDLSKSKAPASTPKVSGSATFTLELFDFGVPVRAQLPPADQVADLKALTGGK